jgi:hypothetical protein
MFAFLMAAIAEIIMGLFVYTFLDPEKVRKMPPLLRWGWVDLESGFFDPEKDLYLIKNANKIFLKFCILSALVTLINGILHVYFNFIDLKEVLIIITVLAVIPLRYGYIFLIKW